MIATTQGAKVYYLPTAELVPDPPPPSAWRTTRRRLLHGWWRLRLSLADFRARGWRRRRRNDYATLLGDVLGESPAQLVERRPRKAPRPATVLDFEAGRLRLRPLAR